jgi:hypothetical protein
MATSRRCRPHAAAQILEAQQTPTVAAIAARAEKEIAFRRRTAGAGAAVLVLIQETCIDHAVKRNAALGMRHTRANCAYRHTGKLLHWISVFLFSIPTFMRGIVSPHSSPERDGLLDDAPPLAGRAAADSYGATVRVQIFSNLIIR